MSAHLEREHQVYKDKLPTLKGDEGKYALVCGNEFVGTFTSYPDALQIGYERCGLGPFLIKQINAIEVVAHFTRDIQESCHT